MRTSSSRTVVMKTLRELIKQRRNSEYFVKRGAIDWISFPFESNEWACAILIDDGGLPDENGFRKARITLEMATSIPSSIDPPEIDDGKSDLLWDDAEAVVLGLEIAKDSRGDGVVFSLDRVNASITEFHDMSVRLQGIVVTFNVVY